MIHRAATSMPCMCVALLLILTVSCTHFGGPGTDPFDECYGKETDDRGECRDAP